MLPTIIGIFATLLIVAWLMYTTKAEEAAENARAKIRSIVVDQSNKHAKTLYIKSKQLISVDDYGKPNYERYRNELLYFLSEIIAPIIRKEVVDGIHMDSLKQKVGNYISSDEFRLYYFKQIEKSLDEYCENNEQNDSFEQDMSPADFEIACANALGKLGWAARTVGQTGDQGADVIATKNINGKEITAVLQCKLYSSPVGNAAVQEVFAAKKHRSADMAAVVTNQSYTKSAKELSNSTGVMLLHHDDLCDFDRLITSADAFPDRAFPDVPDEDEAKGIGFHANI